MDKIKMRIIAVLAFALIFNGVLFGILYSEELKRLAKRDGEINETLAKAALASEARKRYYEQITDDRKKLREQMEKSKADYEAALQEQPARVAEQKREVTKMVETVVPVTTKEAVTASKPTSTKSTKTS